MGTGIGWTSETWNPIRGCSAVSPGCTNCYAATVAANPRMAKSYGGLARMSGGKAVWTGEVRFIEAALTKPLRWRKPRRIFVNSMSDLFHERVTDDQLDRIFAVMALTPQHTYQVLTKRPERMPRYFVKGVANRIVRAVLATEGGWTPDAYDRAAALPLPNVWLGVSVENRETADQRIPILLETPASTRWVSVEPLLENISLRAVGYGPSNRGYVDALTGRTEFAEVAGLPHAAPPLPALDWVVVGGESGKHRRDCGVEAIVSVAQQCQAAGVPVFCKQDCAYRDGQQGRIPDEVWALKQYPREG